MLARHQQVTAEGKYIKAGKKKDSKMHYATMMFTRGSMVRSAGGALARAVCIATRYSCIRRFEIKAIFLCFADNFLALF
jgi:acyl-CoA oxidase